MFSIYCETDLSYVISSHYPMLQPKLRQWKEGEEVAEEEVEEEEGEGEHGWSR